MCCHMSHSEVAFQKIDATDIKPLTNIMKRAFDEDSKRYLGIEGGGPPGYDDGTFLTKYALDSSSQAFKILMENKLIGAVILWIGEDGNNYLGNIFVDPLFQDKGIGTKVWKEIEGRYPETKKWTTETPGFSKRNHNFYVNKCGFKVIKILKPGDREEESYILEKVIE